MHLRDYLALGTSLSVADIRQRMNELGADVKDDAQIRQWAAQPKAGKSERRPTPANSFLLETATGGKVTRQAMRPDDFHVIWPDLPISDPHPAPRAKRVRPLPANPIPS